MDELSLYRFKLVQATFDKTPEGKTKNLKRKIVKENLKEDEAKALHKAEAAKNMKDLEDGKMSYSVVRDPANEDELKKFRAPKTNDENVKLLQKQVQELQEQLAKVAPKKAAASSEA